jgi:uncharacterized protein with FMN-binding domain
MRRAALALVSTVAGLVLLLSFKASAPATPTASAQAPAGSAGGGTSTSAGSSSGGSSGGSAASGSGTYTGDAIDTRYGPVQVRITLSGGKITKVSTVQLPDGDRRSQEISSYAGPTLGQEALDAQSAQVDAVSGATFTSDGYARSLQSALDKARG